MSSRLIPGVGFAPTGRGGLVPGIGFVQNSGGAATATALSISGPPSGMAGYPSDDFTVSANGALAGNTSVTITQTDGTTAPDDVLLSSDVLGANFTYTAGAAGTKTITVTAQGLTPASMQYVAAAYVAPPQVTNLRHETNGDDVKLLFDLADQTDSGVATLTATNGGVSKGAQAITIDNVANTGEVLFVDVAPGTYSGAVSATNVIGTANAATPSNIVIGEISGGNGGEGTPADTTAPIMTGDPTIASITQTSAIANWPAASDAVGVTAYEWRLNGGSWNNVGAALTVPLSGLVASTGYAFDVRARDAAANYSAPTSVNFTTASADGAPAPKEILSIGSKDHTFNDTFNLLVPGEWAEAHFQFGPNPEVNVGDFLTFFGVDQLQGLRIADWYVKSQELDAGAAPTLRMHVGFGSAGGVSGTAGYRFASSREIGTAPAGTVLRDDNFGSHLQNAPASRLGLSVAALPQVAAFANKRITFGILPQAVLYKA